VSEQDIKIAEAKKRMAARLASYNAMFEDNVTPRRARLKSQKQRCGCNRPVEVWLQDETPLCAVCFGYSRRQAEILRATAKDIVEYKG